MTSSISHLFIYPIKSLSGLSVNSAELTDRGLMHDRRWMLVDATGRFITQREDARLCLFKVSGAANGFNVRVNDEADLSVTVPWDISQGPVCEVIIWSDRCQAIEADATVNDFFSHVLQKRCRLVYMPEVSKRTVDHLFSDGQALTAFGDGYPLLLLGAASLQDLNARLTERGEKALGWDRFRPNIVVQTTVPFEEDAWARFRIGNIEGRGVKLCSRCVFTTIDQETGVASKEPLRTLSTYRKIGGKVMFGQNVIADAHQGRISVADPIEVIQRALPANAKS